MKNSSAKYFKNWKPYLAIGLFFVAGLSFYLLQKPFAPSAIQNYQAKWTKYDLAGLQSEIEKNEKTFPNLKKDCDRKVGFASGPQVSKISLTYIPGFTATRKEIFPVVESLAKQFSANYFLTRLPAHGEGPLDYKNLTAESFFETTYEAIEIAAKLGKKKVLVATSTGAALVAGALVQDADIDAAILISPAFAVHPNSSWLLSTRAGPLVNRIMVDEIRHWTPHNPAMEQYWNTSHHRDGLIALLQSVEYVRSLDFSKIKKPILMLYTKNDNVVVTDFIVSKYAEIKEPHKRLVEIPASSHVLAGEFTSPETTELVIKEIHDWLQSLDL